MEQSEAINAGAGREASAPLCVHAVASGQHSLSQMAPEGLGPPSLGPLPEPGQAEPPLRHTQPAHQMPLQGPPSRPSIAQAKPSMLPAGFWDPSTRARLFLQGVDCIRGAGAKSPVRGGKPGKPRRTGDSNTCTEASDSGDGGLEPLSEAGPTSPRTETSEHRAGPEGSCGVASGGDGRLRGRGWGARRGFSSHVPWALRGQPVSLSLPLWRSPAQSQVTSPCHSRRERVRLCLRRGLGGTHASTVPTQPCTGAQPEPCSDRFTRPHECPEP